MPIIPLKGLRFHYAQVGRGPHVVMVHGLGANLAFWSLGVGPVLARKFSVLTYDLRGHGRSSLPALGYTSTEMAGDLSAIIDHLGIQQMHLVGHSFGGEIALKYTLKHPDRVKSLTMADAVIQSLYPNPPDAQPTRNTHLSRKLDEWGVSTSARSISHANRLLEELADPKWDTMRKRRRNAGSFMPFGLWNGSKRSAKRWRELLVNTSALRDFDVVSGPSPDELRSLKVPCLAVFGARSRYLPICWELKRNLASCQTRIVPEVGHFHPFVKARQFSRILMEFLTLVSSQEEGEQPTQEAGDE